MEENKEKKPIPFFKKMWYSIVKPSKYDEMIEDGAKSSIKYFLGVLAVCSLVIGISIMIAIFVLMYGDAELTPAYYMYNFFVYFCAFFICLLLIYGVINLCISIGIFLATKISKIQGGFKYALALTLYSSTLTVIIYTIYIIINQFTGYGIAYFDEIIIIVTFIYIMINIRKKRGGRKNGFYRRHKGKSQEGDKDDNIT